MYCKTCGKEVNEHQEICLGCGCPVGVGNGYCANCGAALQPNAAVCLNCGANANFGTRQAFNQAADPNISDKDWLTTLLICLFVGGLGVHRFYVGKSGTGVLWLLTFGCFGIGTIIDFIMIVCGKFEDANGKAITQKK